MASSPQPAPPRARRSLSLQLPLAAAVGVVLCMVAVWAFFPDRGVEVRLTDGTGFTIDPPAGQDTLSYGALVGQMLADETRRAAFLKEVQAHGFYDPREPAVVQALAGLLEPPPELQDMTMLQRAQWYRDTLRSLKSIDGLRDRAAKRDPPFQPSGTIIRATKPAGGRPRAFHVHVAENSPLAGQRLAIQSTSPDSQIVVVGRGAIARDWKSEGGRLVHLNEDQWAYLGLPDPPTRYGADVVVVPLTGEGTLEDCAGGWVRRADPDSVGRGAAGEALYGC